MALKGCCCCGLRGGALAIGVVFLVLSVLHLLGDIIAWGIVETVMSNEVTYQLTYHSSVSEVYDNHGKYVFINVVLSLNTVFALMSLAFNSMLIHGVNNSSSCAVIAWLVYYCVLFVLFSLGSLGLLIACFVFVAAANNTDKWSYQSDARTLAMIFGVHGGIGLLFGALLWYSWAVVLAFQKQLSAASAGFGYTRGEVLLEQAPPTPHATEPPPPTYADVAAAAAPKEGARKDMREKWEHF